jgi:PAS domain S-box-containing protein
MTTADHTDEGGEAPCFAHLSDEPLDVTDELLGRLARALADAVVIADRDGTITFWNDAASRLFGWPAEEAIGNGLDLIIPERLRARHWAGYRETMATGHTSYGDRLLEVPALHREGRTLSIAFTVTLLRQPGFDQPHAIAAVLRDDTERWQERRRLRAELAALRERQPAAGIEAEEPDASAPSSPD